MRYNEHVPGVLELANLLPLACPASTSEWDGSKMSWLHWRWNHLEIVFESSWNHLDIWLHHIRFTIIGQILQGLCWAPQSLPTIQLGMLGFKTSLVPIHTPSKPYSYILHLPSFSMWMLSNTTPKKWYLVPFNNRNLCHSRVRSAVCHKRLWKLRRRDLFGLLGMVSSN